LVYVWQRLTAPFANLQPFSEHYSLIDGSTVLVFHCCVKPAVRFIIATRNAHKIEEIRRILGDQFGYLSLKEFSGAPSVVEDANTFAGNAAKKALQLAKWLVQAPSPEFPVPHAKTFVLADDSGLEVDALDGNPGVNSARFAALDGSTSSPPGNSPDAANNAKLLQLLRSVPAEQRVARFRCVLALAEVNPTSLIHGPQLFEGVCEGRIDFALRGQQGFGYDPLFVPAGHNQSFAELGEDIKNTISHRAKALRKLREWLSSHAGSQ
jgi:XTP/dITP diphosphohydrolase